MFARRKSGSEDESNAEDETNGQIIGSGDSGSRGQKRARKRKGPPRAKGKDNESNDGDESRDVDPDFKDVEAQRDSQGEESAFGPFDFNKMMRSLSQNFTNPFSSTEAVSDPPGRTECKAARERSVGSNGIALTRRSGPVLSGAPRSGDFCSSNLRI